MAIGWQIFSANVAGRSYRSASCRVFVGDESSAGKDGDMAIAPSHLDGCSFDPLNDTTPGRVPDGLREGLDSLALVQTHRNHPSSSLTPILRHGPRTREGHSSFSRAIRECGSVALSSDPGGAHGTLER